MVVVAGEKPNMKVFCFFLILFVVGPTIVVNLLSRGVFFCSRLIIVHKIRSDTIVRNAMLYVKPNSPFAFFLDFD